MEHLLHARPCDSGLSTYRLSSSFHQPLGVGSIIPLILEVKRLRDSD